MQRAGSRTTALCAALLLLAGIEPAYFAQTTPLSKTGPTTSRPALLSTVNPAGSTVLLVDDDESDNNNIAGSGKLSVSDTFYRTLLQMQSLTFDTVVVPRYSDGPSLKKLKAYSLIIWYTGASYGGNRDNTSVISLKDEQTLTSYLQDSGGTVLLFSPGYLNNALGAGGAALWEQKQSPFLQQVLGIKGGRGLLQRFKDGTVTASGGGSYAVTKNPSVETQFSALNPATAQVLYTATLDPNGKGAQQIAVASSNAVGSGRFVYVGFTFENVSVDAGAAFGRLVQATSNQTTNNVAAPKSAAAGANAKTASASPPSRAAIAAPPSTAVPAGATPFGNSRLDPTPVPSHGLPFLSKTGAGSDAETLSYYAQLPTLSNCSWGVLSDWACESHAASPTLEDWLRSFTWNVTGDTAGPPSTLGVTAAYYNADDLAVGRRATCGDYTGSSPDTRANYGIYCLVTNHGPVPGTTGHPGPVAALADAAANRAPFSVSVMFRSRAQESEETTFEVTESTGWGAGAALSPGDVVTIGPATGSIWAGNILYGANDPDGVGVPCATTIFDPAPCPLEGAPLYGLLLEVPPSTTSDGVAIAGRRFVGTNTLTFKVTGLYAPSDILHSNGIELRVNDHVHGNGSGAFSVPVTIRRASTTSFQVYVPGPAGTYTPIAAATSLDTEGAKRVPRSCIACHGGRWDPETQTVSGASFLPFDVGRLTFPSTPGQTRAAQEAQLAALNTLVLKTAPNASNPNDPIGSWIRGTYAGGSTANDAFVPPGWSGDRRLYQRVVGPYCRICHQALGPGLDFSSAAQFRGLAAAIEQATCVNRTMPHAEPTFIRFWQSDAPRVLSQDLLGGARCGP